MVPRVPVVVAPVVVVVVAAALVVQAAVVVAARAQAASSTKKESLPEWQLVCTERSIALLAEKLLSEEIQEELHQLDAETFEIEDFLDLGEDSAGGSSSTSCSSTTGCSCSCSSTCSTSCSSCCSCSCW